MILRGGIDKSGRPLTTAATFAPETGRRLASWAASILSTRACGNRMLQHRAKSGPYSTRVRSPSVTPRASSARVKTPVPGPSLRDRTVAARFHWVIEPGERHLDGATAATRSGLAIQDRKNWRMSEYGHAAVTAAIPCAREPTTGLGVVTYVCTRILSLE